MLEPGIKGHAALRVTTENTAQALGSGELPVLATPAVAALIEKARENGGVFITLEVRTSNLPAIAMYRSLGFTEAGVRRNFYTEPREDALIFTLSF